MRKRRVALNLGLFFLHFLLLSWVLWYFEPRPESSTRVVEGYASPYKTCSSRSCDTGLRVDRLVLACGVDPIATSFSCPDLPPTDKPVRATYFQMPTLLSTAGLSVQSSVLLSLEQGHVVIWQRTASKHRSDYYLIGSWVLIAAFGASFLLLTRLSFFRR